MHIIRLKNNSQIKVDVRLAVYPDVKDLLHLNNKWQRAMVGINIKDGYLGAAFSEDTFIKLIDNKQVPIAEYDKKIVGYYLVNNLTKDGVIAKHEDIVFKLKHMGLLQSNLKVCIGSQTVVDTNFMGSGIRELMLKTLVGAVKSNYEALFGTIAKDNLRAFRAHTKDGWKIIGEDENLYFVIYEI